MYSIEYEDFVRNKLVAIRVDRGAGEVRSASTSLKYIRNVMVFSLLL